MEGGKHAKGDLARRSVSRAWSSLPRVPVVWLLGAVILVVAGSVVARGAWRSGGAPVEARVSCTIVGPRLQTNLVRPQPDGVHLAFENPGGAEQFDVHPARWSAGSSVGGPLGDGVTRAELSAPPGELVVTCLGDHGFVWGRPAHLTVVDPSGMWISPEPACSDARAFDVGAGPPPDQPAPALIARSVLGGIQDSDRLLKPGYPQTWWHGNLLVVVRGARTIAAITQYADQGRWLVHVDVCPGNHLVTPP